MLPPLASLVDFTNRLGRSLTGAEQTRAEAAITDASAVVRTEAHENWVDAEGVLTEVPEAIVAVMLAVARRVFDNPEGRTSESLGQHAEGWANPTSDVYLKASEKNIISAAMGRGGGIGVLQTTRGDLETGPGCRPGYVDWDTIGEPTW